MKQDISQESGNTAIYLDSIINHLPHHIFWKDTHSTFLGCNKLFAQSAGFDSPSEVIGKKDSDMPWRSESENYVADDKKIMQTGRAKINYEERQPQKDGSEAIMLVSKVPMYDAKHEVVGILGIYTNITERKKAEKALRLAKEKAEAANKAKTEFLFNMRHDLRTPFSGVLGMAEILERTEKDPKRKEYLGDIVQSAQILHEHLDEILEFIHLEENQLPVLEKQFDLNTLFDDLYKMMWPAAKDKGLTLEVKVFDGVPKYLIGDRVRTQRILISLLSNAIKFTKEGHVKLTVELAKSEDKGGVLKYVVEDTGVGIPEDKYNVIFETFNRLTSSYSGVYAGKGFGLRIVKHFLDEIGGEVHVQSELNKGSVFKLLIPYKKTLLNCPEKDI